MIPWTAGWAQQPPDTALVTSKAILQELRGQGFWFARMDSSLVGGDSVFIQHGPRVRLHRVVVDLPSGVPEQEVQAIWKPWEGKVLTGDRYRRGLEALLRVLERSGFPLARVQVASAHLAPDSTRVTLLLRVISGERVPLARMEAVGARRVPSSLLYRLLGVRPGRLLTSYDPERFRQILLSSGLFQEVGEPRLQVYEHTGAVIQIPLRERSPGTFDVTVGLQPGGLVGQGHLELRNILGGGRFLRMQLQRQPGLVTRMHVELEDPFVVGLPVGLGLVFEGYQQDSTFSTQDLALKIGWQNASRWYLYVTVRWRNAQAGGRRETFPASRARGTGLGMRYTGVDVPENPSKGIWGDVLVETRLKYAGGKEKRQQSIQGALRVFSPWGRRGVWAVGMDIRYIQADSYDRGDLFPLGGATTLRGYAEDRFWGSLVFRGLVEYRHRLGPRSFAFVFSDLGGVRTSRFHWLPGYGVGIRYETPMGLTTVTYALNPEEGFRGGKIHVGLGVGL